MRTHGNSDHYIEQATRAGLEHNVGLTKDELLEMSVGIWTGALSAGVPAGEMTDDIFVTHLDRIADAVESRKLAEALRYFAAADSREGLLTVVALGMWADNGFPQVEMGQKLAAALLVSDVTPDALELARPPWNSFIIEVPDGLLHTFDPLKKANVPIRRVIVFKLDKHYHGQWAYVAWSSSAVTLWRYGVTTAELLPPALDPVMPDWSEMEVTDEDSRVTALIGRLIINTCLAMSMPDLATQHGPGHTSWEKSRGDARKMSGHIRQFRLVKPVVIDLREHVKGYIRGERGKIEVRTLVRGHFKRQHYGAGNALVKVIWREPYRRGPEDGEVLVRPHVIKSE